MKGSTQGILLGAALAAAAVLAAAPRAAKEAFSSSRKLKVKVLMFSTTNILKYARLSAKINEMYCRRHGYAFEHVVDDDRPGRPVWQKVFLVKERLPRWDAVVWIDSDAIFNDHTVPLDKWLDSAAEFIICSDWPNGPSLVNTGVFIAKNTPFCADLMEQWAGMVDKGTYNTKFPFEQGALEDLIRRLGKDSTRVNVLPAEELNSVFGDVSRGQFKTFVMHLMALPASYRQKVFAAWLKHNKVEGPVEGTVEGPVKGT